MRQRRRSITIALAIATCVFIAPADILGLPGYFSWGDYEGENYMSTPGNQGSCGSCWAFTISSMYEARLRKLMADPDLQVNISEKFMLECWDGGCDGASPYTMLGLFQTMGCVSDSCYPYSLPYEGVCDPCDDWSEQMYYISAYDFTYPQSVNHMKKEIYYDGPINVLMAVYGDFYDYHGGVYQHVSGSFAGSQSMTLYGWNDADSSWLAQNTWGTSTYWGEIGPGGTGGWMRIRMGTNECGVEDYMWTLTPEPLPACCEARTGDVDGSGSYPSEVDSSDLGGLVNFLFSPPGTVVLVCTEEADVDAQGGPNPVDSSDLGVLVAFLFAQPPGSVLLPDCP